MQTVTKAAVAPRPVVETASRLLVGWDGSLPSIAALRWALEQADRSSAPVTVLHVVEPGAHDGQRPELDRIVADAAVSHPAVTVTTEVVEAPVVRGLVQAPQRPADLLVVGTHRTGEPRERRHTTRQESRSVQIAAALRSPLVVVPDVDLRLRSGVVVGVQDGDEAVRLGAIAGAECEARGRDVLVIHATGARPSSRTQEHGRADAALLDTARAAACAGGRTVRSRSVDRDPRDALLDAAHASALLVIGSSAATGPERPLSPTVHDVLLNVNAPTLIVPTPTAEERERTMTDATETAADPVQVMDERECWNHLEQEQLGRLAVTLRGETEIFPVNYLAQQGRILIRTAAGTKLAGVLISSRVTFEIDGHDDTTAWSVVVKGVAEEVPTHTTELQVRTLPVPWVDTVKDALIEITPDTVSGRRFRRGRA